MDSLSGNYRVLLIGLSERDGEAVSMAFSLGWPDVSLHSVSTGEEGISALETGSFHLVILDIELPDMRGVDLVRRLRRWSDVPLIVLSDLRDEMETVRVLEAGADDCVARPVSPLGLLARAKAVLRRSASYGGRQDHLGSWSRGALVVDFALERVYLEGEQIALTPTEFRILCHLVRNSGRVVPMEALCRNGRAEGEEGLCTSTVRKTVSRLRRKLGRHGKENLILNERGLGYRLVVQEVEESEAVA